MSRLVGSSLGSQAGWLLGSAVVSAVALVVSTRLRRRDQRTGFVLMIGLTVLVIGIVFSFASGIFHPYYVSMLAPWVAMLSGAGVGEMLPAPLGVARSSRSARLVGPAVVVGGAITELVVLGGIDGQLSWGVPVTIVAAAIGSGLLIWNLSSKARVAVLAVSLAGLLAAPVAWATETLGHATSGTFPIGGPASAEVGGGFPGGGRGFPGAPRSVNGGGFAPPAGGASGVVGQLFGGSPGCGLPRAGGPGGFGAGSGELDAAASYAKRHGGGVARKVTFTHDGQSYTMYDLRGRADAILAAANSA